MSKNLLRKGKPMRNKYVIIEFKNHSIVLEDSFNAKSRSSIDNYLTEEQKSLLKNLSQYRNYIMWIMCYFGRTTKKVYWSDKRKDNFLEDVNLESMKVQKVAKEKQLQTTEKS